MTRVGVLLVLTCCPLSNARAQAWRDLVNKAKEKAKQAAAVGDTASHAARNAQTAHGPAGQPWYSYCASNTGYVRHVTKVFPLAHDAKTYLGVNSSWKSFAHDQYGLRDNGLPDCAQFPSEQAANTEKERSAKSLTDHNRDTPPPYRIVISEVDWTPESAPTGAVSPTAGAGQSQAPRPGVAVAAGPSVYTYCVVTWGSPDFATTAYVTAVFPTHKQDPPTMNAAYVVPFRAFILEKYHVARGRRYNKGSTCDDGYATEALATARRQDVLTSYKSNPSIRNVIETGWAGGGQAGASAPD